MRSCAGPAPPCARSSLVGAPPRRLDPLDDFLRQLRALVAAALVDEPAELAEGLVDLLLGGVPAHGIHPVVAYLVAHRVRMVDGRRTGGLVLVDARRGGGSR